MKAAFCCSNRAAKNRTPGLALLSAVVRRVGSAPDMGIRSLNGTATKSLPTGRASAAESRNPFRLRLAAGFR
jgi:hypothetical protein